MSTPTKEQILRAFSLYPGQDMMWHNRKYRITGVNHNSGCIHDDSDADHYFVNEYPKLLLREIQDLTDEECKEIARLAISEEDDEYFEVASIKILRSTQYGQRVSISWGVMGNCVEIFPDFSITYINSDGEALAPPNMYVLTDYITERGFNRPLACLGGLTPVQANIATIKKEVSNE